MYIGDYQYVNISSFAVLGIKLWLEEDGDLNRNNPLYSFRFIQSKAQIDTKCYHLLTITCKYFQLCCVGYKAMAGRRWDLNRNDPLYSFKFIQSKAQIDTKCYHLLTITLYPT